MESSIRVRHTSANKITAAIIAIVFMGFTQQAAAHVASDGVVMIDAAADSKQGEAKKLNASGTLELAANLGTVATEESKLNGINFKPFYVGTARHRLTGVAGVTLGAAAASGQGAALRNINFKLWEEGDFKGLFTNILDNQIIDPAGDLTLVIDKLNPEHTYRVQLLTGDVRNMGTTFTHDIAGIKQSATLKAGQDAMISNFIVSGETQVKVRVTSDAVGAIPATIQAVLITSDRDPDDLPEQVTSQMGWVDLFDGKTLDGWTQAQGTADYRVEGGIIIGKTAEGSPNSFLRTEKDYGDFELVFDVNVDNPLNSGVQIRSRKTEGVDQWFNGPQVEIEAANPEGSLSGYIYGESAGGWMTPDKDRVRHKHFKNEQWNTYRVVAVGPRIKTWINGELIGDIVHEDRYKSHPTGAIALQVHGIPGGTGPYEVRWRNIRIRHLETIEDADFVQLYNGKDLTGWTTEGNWIIQDDGSIKSNPREGEVGWEHYKNYLWANKKYKDFTIDFEVMYPPGGNSGFYFRVADNNNPVFTGIEAQINETFGKETGLNDHDTGGIIMVTGPMKNMAKPAYEWNRMRVTCIGKHVQVEVNGEKVTDLQLDQTVLKDRPAEGYIGFQDHGRPHTLSFRNIRIKEIVPEKQKEAQGGE